MQGIEFWGCLYPETLVYVTVKYEQIKEVHELNIQGVPKKGVLRILNRFYSYCLQEHLDGSKLGKNM